MMVYVRLGRNMAEMRLSVRDKNHSGKKSPCMYAYAQVILVLVISLFTYFQI